MHWWFATELAADDASDPRTWYDHAKKFWRLGMRYIPQAVTMI
jgi:hypothetical protein